MHHRFRGDGRPCRGLNFDCSMDLYRGAIGSPMSDHSGVDCVSLRYIHIPGLGGGSVLGNPVLEQSGKIAFGFDSRFCTKSLRCAVVTSDYFPFCASAKLPSTCPVLFHGNLDYLLFHDTVITKMISVTLLLYPGLGLALYDYGNLQQLGLI